MKRLFKIIVAASLFALSGNAPAIMMNNQLYGSSGYSLDDIDAAILAFQDAVSSKKERRHLKKASRLDRKIERLVYKVDSAMASGNERKLRKKTRKLNRKEAKLLAILADYLPDLDELLQDGNLPTTNDLLPGVDVWPPQPGILLTQLDLETEPVVGSSGDNEPGTTLTTFEATASENSSVPEPTMLALLSLGLAGLMFPGRSLRK